MKSMTGFGKGQADKSGIAVVAEISTVNRKQLDVRLNLPSELRQFEPRFRKMVAGAVQRGSISIKVQLTYGEELIGQSISIDHAAASAYVAECMSLGEELGIDATLSVRDLINIPDFVTRKAPAVDSDLMAEIAEEAIAKALADLVAMRSVEGAELYEDLKQRRLQLMEMVAAIAERAPAVVQEYRGKLKERVELLTEDLELDNDTLIREVAVFADRADISEEMTRLQSHFVQMEQLFESGDGVGRALDFLIQEMFREINTTGSKANDSEISRNVVSFKTELERVREQVQNIE